jgi:hypothetical protein
MINHSNENTILDDANSPELSKRLMGVISQDFVQVADVLKEAAYQIKQRGFSAHPIFVTSQSSLAIGQLLIAGNELQNKWNYHASLLEEFVQRNLIAENALELFKENYKNPEEYACLFVYHGDFAGFVFVPYPID